MKAMETPVVPVALRTFATALAICCALLTSSDAAAEYRLGPGDSLRISVHGRSDLTGQFDVRPSGAISFPLLGQVRVEGFTLSETERRLQEALDAILSEHHFVNVHVTRFRPFFIDGDVAKPGAYPYQSGLDVVQAIAIAGGRRSARSAGEMSSLERARQLERLEIERLDYKSDVAREARLLAERDGLSETRFPEDLLNEADDPRTAEILANETRIFETRRDGFSGEITILEQRLIEGEEQRKALVALSKSAAKRLRISKEQLERMRKLAQQGTISKSALTQQELSLMTVENETRGVEVRVVEAKLNISITKQSIVNLRTQRASSIAAEIAALQQRITNARIRIQGLVDRLDEVAGELPEEMGAVYRISRASPDGIIKQMEASAHTLVQPGDVLRVPFPERDDSLPERVTSNSESPDRFTSDTKSPDRFTSDTKLPDRFTSE